MLEYLKNFSTPLDYTTHILNQFYNDHSTILTYPTIVHQELYDYIATQRQANIESIVIKFSYLRVALITKAIKCKKHILGYKYPTPQIPHLPPQINNPTFANDSTSIMTWNIATSILCIHKLLTSHKLTIITLQETKLTSKKSLKYLQKIFSNYTLFFNNTQFTFQLVTTNIRHLHVAVC